MNGEIAADTNPSMSQQEHKAAFFKHSGWLMITTFTAGILTWGVHFLSKKVSTAEWGTFVTLLTMTMFIPGNPLQMVFAQQTASGIALHRERELTGKIRLVLAGIFALCGIAAVFLLVGKTTIMAHLKIYDPVALWMAWLSVLLSFLMPLFLGVLQGKQNFLWFGWGTIFNGLGRVFFATLIVFTIAASAAGMMAGVAAGLAMSVCVGAWQTRNIWLGSSERFDWQAFLKQVLPLMFGFAAGQFLFSADTIFVKSYFTSEEAGIYGAAGTLSRALVWFVGPLTAVMFPKIVHSSVRSEKSNLMGLTLLCTAVLAALGAVALWILGPFVVKFVYKAEFVPLATAVLPWYAAAMLPYCIANVLLSNLLAKSDFRIVPAVVVVAIAYAVTLTYVHSTLIVVLQMVGLFNLGLLAVSAWFTWGMKPAPNTAAA
jgi:O-antigen/teichoic acid export membrane protein